VAGTGSLLLEEEFGARSLDGLRQAVREQAASAGMSEERVGDVMIAVHELASNAVRHGAGRGRLRMWSQDGALSCQVQDGGRGPRGGQADGPDGADVAAGWPYAHDHGLWLVRLLADQMSVVSSPGGTCVTVIFALG
jgi:anti-sigma regulatory factor (Ser/Thr protein kinase)